MRSVALCLMLCGMLVISGCLYPDHLRKENQVPPHEYIMLVQNAVDLYRQKTGVLPIKNSEMDTPVYEKYVIDFRRLKDQHVLGAIPANAFENGGTNLYVLVDAETEPKVKLLDLISYQQIGDLQKKSDEYRKKHGGKLPAGERINDHFYWLDTKKLGMNNVEIRSPYSRQLLNPVIHESGKVALDYGPDIMRLLEQKPPEASDPGQDLRELLVREFNHVPVHSFPYRFINNEPVLSEN